MSVFLAWCVLPAVAQVAPPPVADAGGGTLVDGPLLPDWRVVDDEWAETVRHREPFHTAPDVVADERVWGAPMMVLVLLAACGGEAPPGDSGRPVVVTTNDSGPPVACDLADYPGVAVALDHRVYATFVGEEEEAWAGYSVACMSRDQVGPGAAAGLWAVGAPEHHDYSKEAGTVYVFQGGGEPARDDAVHIIEGSYLESDSLGLSVGLVERQGGPSILGASWKPSRNNTHNRGVAFVHGVDVGRPGVTPIDEADLLISGVDEVVNGAGGNLVQLLPVPDVDGGGEPEFVAVWEGMKVELYRGETATRSMARRRPDHVYHRPRPGRAHVGDLDGDGNLDMALFEDYTGFDRAIAIRFGPLLGGPREQDFGEEVLIQLPDHRFESNGPGHIGWVADVNADGVDDVIVNSQLFRDSYDRESFTHVFFGPFVRGTTLTEADADATFHEVGERSYLWARDVADHDGDGFPDLVFIKYRWLPYEGCASVLVVPGPLAPGAYTAEDARFAYVAERGSLVGGSDVASCDLDGDGDDELVLGEFGYLGGTGRAIVVEGGPFEE